MLALEFWLNACSVSTRTNNGIMFLSTSIFMSFIAAIINVVTWWSLRESISHCSASCRNDGRENGAFCFPVRCPQVDINLLNFKKTSRDKIERRHRRLGQCGAFCVARERMSDGAIAKERVLRAARERNWENNRSCRKKSKISSHCGMKICIFSTFQYATTKNTNVVCWSWPNRKRTPSSAIKFNYFFFYTKKIIAQLILKVVDK